MLEGGPHTHNDAGVDKITSYMDQVDDAKKGRDHVYIVKLISEYFSQKLFSLIHEIFVRKEDKDQEAQDYAEELEDQEYLAALGEEGEGDRDLADQDPEFVGENKYVRMRKQREKERKLNELKKWEFPQKIGSYNEYTQPALEFSKQICNNIFALDEAFSAEANTLKKNLLKIVHEKEFSPQVVNGNEPSLILVLPDVICEVCQIASDIDICRDPFLNKES